MYSIHFHVNTLRKGAASIKKIPFGQNKRHKLSPAPTHQSFIFNLRFLYELKHKLCLSSKTVCGIFHFRFCFTFINVYIFVQQNAWTL